MKNQKGFSLIELLVVVIIIGIIAAIAVPSLLSSRKAANEGSAIATVRSFGTAQATYQASNGGTGYAADNTALAGLLDTSLTGAATGTRNGYVFTTTGTSAGLMCVMANPSSSSTGTRRFAMKEDYVVRSGTADFTCASGAYGGGGTVAIITN